MQYIIPFVDMHCVNETNMGWVVHMPKPHTGFTSSGFNLRIPTCFHPDPPIAALTDTIGGGPSAVPYGGGVVFRSGSPKWSLQYKKICSPFERRRFWIFAYWTSWAEVSKRHPFKIVG